MLGCTLLVLTTLGFHILVCQSDLCRVLTVILTSLGYLDFTLLSAGVEIMGKHSPSSKRGKRKKQKARCKLKIPTRQVYSREGSSSSSDLQDMECQHKSDVDVLGLDLDVLGVSLEDAFSVPDEHLQCEGRKNLMRCIIFSCKICMQRILR